MFCPECGEKNSDNSRFCMNCGTNLQNVEQQQDSQYDAQPAKGSDDYSQPRYEAPQQGGSSGYAPRGEYQAQQYTKSDEPGAFSYICSFCLPIVGLILFFVHRKEHPDAARNLLIVAIVSFSLGILSNLGAQVY